MVIAVIIFVASLVLTSKILKIINRGTIGTTEAYFKRSVTVFFIILAILGCLTQPLWDKEEDTKGAEEDVIEAGEDSEDMKYLENNDYYEDEELWAEDGETDYAEYLFLDSDSRYLEESDLEGLDKELLRIARNEIFARHGRRFNSEDLQDYFDTCSWYEGTIEPENFDEGILNAYEKANMKFIKEHE